MFKKAWGRNYWSRSTAAAMIVAAMSAPAIAQEITASLNGTVLDNSGKPIADATITILHKESGTLSVRKSGRGGRFSASGLRPGGPYLITVSKDDYLSSEQDNVTIDVSDPYRANFVLASTKASEGTQEILVVGKRHPYLLPGQTVLDRDHIDVVTSIQRDIRDLIRRDPLATQNTNGNGGISLAGQLPQANRLTIEGVSAKDDFGINTGGLPTSRGPVSLEAIEQLSVQVAPFDVESGNFLGGDVNVVLKSGTNKLKGSGTWETDRNFLAGDRVADRTITAPFRGRTFSGSLSGPIIKDKLFFAGSYESFGRTELTGTGPTADRPGDPVFTTQRNITASALDAFNQTVQRLYNYTPLGIPLTTPFTDRKWNAKVDWNITDKHRATFTYRSARDSQVNRPTPAGTSLSLPDGSYDYNLREVDTSYTGQINSDWTRRLSTEFRITRRSYDRFQDPLEAGDNPDGTAASQASSFAEVLVCDDPTDRGSTTSCSSGSPTFVPTLAFGPDRFRHANLLRTDSLGFKFKAQYNIANHRLKAGFERQFNTDSNLILPNSQGIYYFDSVADFVAGRANQFIYSNALSGVPTDASADFKFSINTAYLSDTIDVTRKLTLDVGLRLDLYTSGTGGPLFSQAFVNRQAGLGFANNDFIGGRKVFQPRFGFDYRPDARTTIRGGLGLYAALISDVLALSSTTANDGVRTNTIQITRVGANSFRLDQGDQAGFTQAIGASALNVFSRTTPFDLFNIPANVQGLLASGGAPTSSSVVALSPDFRVPSTWKANLNITRNVDAGILGKDWHLGFNFLYQLVQNSYFIYEARLSPNGLLPDGRQRYIGDNPNTVVLDRATPGTAGDNGFDFIFGNTRAGNSRAFTWSVGKHWEFLDLNFSYARQDVNSVIDGQIGGTTAQSQYSGTAVFDPNLAQLGTSSQEVKNSLKYEFNFHHKFFGNLLTRFNFFGERRSGRPFSYVFGDPTATGNTVRSSTFGTLGGTRFLFYVPDFAADANPNDLTVGPVVFADQNTLNVVRNFVLNGPLARYQGQISPRNAFRSPAFNTVDLTVNQEIPFFLGHHPEIYFSISNLLNLINRNFGVLRENGNVRVVNVQCSNATGQTTTAAIAACTNYLYSSANTTPDQVGIAVGASRWTATIGLRYRF